MEPHLQYRNKLIISGDNRWEANLSSSRRPHISICRGWLVLVLILMLMWTFWSIAGQCPARVVMITLSPPQEVTSWHQLFVENKLEKHSEIKQPNYLSSTQMWMFGQCYFRICWNNHAITVTRVSPNQLTLATELCVTALWAQENKQGEVNYIEILSSNILSDLWLFLMAK